MSAPTRLAIVPWTAERLDELVALVASSAAFEDLTGDELLTACWERPGVVLGDVSGLAAVAVGVGRDGGDGVVGVVRLLAVHPDRQRLGWGSALVQHAADWVRDRGATRLELGGVLPFPLWPGVDVGSGLGELADSIGFDSGSAGQSLMVPVTFRSEDPSDVTVRRVVRDDDFLAVTLATAQAWPHLSDEVARALEHGTCHGAFGSDENRNDVVLGIGCHSVTRATWIGPFVVVPAHRRRGIGHALLGQICRDLMIAEFHFAEAPGVVDEGFGEFLLAAGATGSRRFTRHVKYL